MTSKFFSSIGFSVCAFIFLVLIAIMYFTKRKQRKTHSNSFAFLIGITAFLLIMEVCYVYSMHNSNTNPMLIEILCTPILIKIISLLLVLHFFHLPINTITTQTYIIFDIALIDGDDDVGARLIEAAVNAPAAIFTKRHLDFVAVKIGLFHP